MAYRHPQIYSFGILRPSNSSRQPMDFDIDDRLNRFYLNARSRPVIWDTDDEGDSFYPSGGRGSRYQDAIAGGFSAPPRLTSRGRGRLVRGPDLTSQPGEVLGEYGRRTARTALVRERSDALPFNLAVSELFRQLEAATKFYIGFGKEYGEDIKKIKQYATPEILESLWIRKVRRAKNPTGASQSHEEEEYTGTAFAEDENQFATWKRKVSYALDGAISSSLDIADSHDRNSGARQQSMARMVEKIRTANRQLLPLLDTAWEREQACKDLITELKMLRDLVNPGQSSAGSQTNQEASGGVPLASTASNEVAEEVKEGEVEWSSRW